MSQFCNFWQHFLAQPYLCKKVAFLNLWSVNVFPYLSKFVTIFLCLSLFCPWPCHIIESGASGDNKTEIIGLGQLWSDQRQGQCKQALRTKEIKIVGLYVELMFLEKELELLRNNIEKPMQKSLHKFCQTRKSNKYIFFIPVSIK